MDFQATSANSLQPTASQGASARSGGTTDSRAEPRTPGQILVLCVLYFILPIYPFDFERFKKRFNRDNGDVQAACKSTIQRWQVYVIVSALLATVTFPVITVTNTSAECPKCATCEDPCHTSSDPVKQLYVTLTAISFLAASFCALTYMYQLLHYSVLENETKSFDDDPIVRHLWILDILAFLSFHVAFTSCNVAVVVAAIRYLDVVFREFLIIAGSMIILLGVCCRVIFLSAFDLETGRLW